MPNRIEHFQTLIAQQPDNELFHFSLAQALVADGRASEAIPHYEFCLAKKPDWMMSRILFGKLLLSLGRTAEARPILEAALRLAVEQHHETPEAELRAILESLR